MYRSRSFFGFLGFLGFLAYWFLVFKRGGEREGGCGEGKGKGGLHRFTHLKSASFSSSMISVRYLLLLFPLSPL